MGVRVRQRWQHRSAPKAFTLMIKVSGFRAAQTAKAQTRGKHGCRVWGFDACWWDCKATHVHSRDALARQVQARLLVSLRIPLEVVVPTALQYRRHRDLHLRHYQEREGTGAIEGRLHYICTMCMHACVCVCVCVCVYVYTCVRMCVRQPPPRRNRLLHRTGVYRA